MVCQGACCNQPGAVYSPFTPWGWHGLNFFDCWGWAICVYDQADGARLQQFQATALVMGLVPLFLKDIAWPERRIVPIQKKLPPGIEMLVRALGLVPVINPTEFDHLKTARIHTKWQTNKLRFWLGFSLTVAMLLGSYGILAVVEIYSKRSCLGCVYPIFVLSWFIVAMIPASCETIASTWRQSRSGRVTASSSTETPPDPEQPSCGGRAPRVEGSGSSLPATAAEATCGHPKDYHKTIALQPFRKAGTSPIQGGDEIWVVQLLWGVYYAGGVLIFTSIMAVTVVELFVWVSATFLTTTLSRLLGYRLCRYCLCMTNSPS